MKYKLEVGARTVDDALAAERGGADRVELYSSPMEGALTPSAGLIKATAEAVNTLKLFVMIRPRAGDFLYSNAEFQTMLRDTEIAVEMGADGIMCGILHPDGTLDMKRMEQIIRRSGGKKFTLHRAFDFARDPLDTLKQAIDLGCNYILTIGQEHKARFGKNILNKIIEQAEDRIKVMIALGADFDTAKEMEKVVKDTGATDYHIVNGYRMRASDMEWSGNEPMSKDDYLKHSMYSFEYLSEPAVREVRDILDKLETENK